MARFRVPFFRIFYSTTYTSLYIIQLVMLAITPGSLIYSSIEARALQYLFIVGGVYFLTAFTALFLYSSRLFTNRTILAAVGKSWIPIEPDELPRRVRSLIAAQLSRSARIVLETRPRPLAPDPKPGRFTSLDPARPPWGHFTHRGHFSPDLTSTGQANPGVRFADIVAELPHLLEARLVSLGGAPLPSPGQGLKAYLETNADMGVRLPAAAPEFLVRYEHARFGGRPLSEDEFVALAACFAEVLAGLGDEGAEDGYETPRAGLLAGSVGMPGLSRMVSAESLASARSVVAMTGR